VATKEQMIEAIQDLPADASYEDAIERLFLLYKIEQGLADIEAGRTFTQEEARQRMAQWLR
jgi:predicted transcriptional regulator